jgi:hypothetical protein
MALRRRPARKQEKGVGPKPNPTLRRCSGTLFWFDCSLQIHRCEETPNTVLRSVALQASRFEAGPVVPVLTGQNALRRHKVPIVDPPLRVPPAADRLD